jgi:hypothetical protein
MKSDERMLGGDGALGWAQRETTKKEAVLIILPDQESLFLSLFSHAEIILH